MLKDVINKMPRDGFSAGYDIDPGVGLLHNQIVVISNNQWEWHWVSRSRSLSESAPTVWGKLSDSGSPSLPRTVAAGPLQLHRPRIP